MANWSRQRVVRWTIGATMTLFLLLGLAAYRSVSSASRDDFIIQNSCAALLDLDVVVRIVLDAKASQWGYLITGKEEFLKDYDDGRKQQQAALAKLEQTESFSPPKLDHLKRLCDL